MCHMTVAMLQTVFRATVTRWQSCFEMDGGHVEREQPCVCCNILYVVIKLLFPKNVLGLYRHPVFCILVYTKFSMMFTWSKTVVCYNMNMVSSSKRNRHSAMQLKKEYRILFVARL